MAEMHPDRVLRQHLATDRLLGVPWVPVNDDAAWDDEAADADATAAPSPRSEPSAPAPRESAPREPVKREPPPARAQPESPPPAATPPRTEQRPSAFREPPPPSKGLSSTMPTPGEASTQSRDEKLVVLNNLDENEVKGCTACELHLGRTQTVFGEGDPDAKILFIGEGPGQTEDELGRPFVGRAGDLLTKMIEAIGYQREDVFIANVVKCRPPNNRTPTPAEVASCSDFLHRQIAAIRPRAIVTLGGPAAKLMLDTKIGITRLRGTWHVYRSPGIDAFEIPVMPTFHPAYLLRQYTKENRRLVWEDLKQVVKLVESADA